MNTTAHQPNAVEVEREAVKVTMLLRGNPKVLCRFRVKVTDLPPNVQVHMESTWRPQEKVDPIFQKEYIRITLEDLVGIGYSLENIYAQKKTDAKRKEWAYIYMWFSLDHPGDGIGSWEPYYGELIEKLMGSTWQAGNAYPNRGAVPMVSFNFIGCLGPKHPPRNIICFARK
ncbi:MAG: hypothetical protein AAB862_00305 [Patescibacteria group bacterium]